MNLNDIEHLSEERKKIISYLHLEDDVIDYFNRIMNALSQYKTYCTWQIQLSDIAEVSREKSHIQILYSSPPSKNPSDIGHWVCSYYDSTNIFIYDSLNTKYLHPDFEKVLKILHPYYFLEKKNVLFPTVQQQRNSVDCGVFAISFAVSLLNGIKPNKVDYKIDQMRPHLLKMLNNKCIEHFPCNVKQIPINENPRNIYDMQIMKDSCLNDLHIDFFQQIISKISFYRPSSTLYLQYPSRIVAIPEDSKHIQILFQRGGEIGHWICTFYDTNALFIYDSLNFKTLQSDHLTVLQKLHPYCFNKKKPIVFKKVQQQSNGIDCGVFAIAFATSLLFGYRPEDLKYQENYMRGHLIKMFQNRTVEHFKCCAIINNDKVHLQNSFSSQPNTNRNDCNNLSHEFKRRSSSSNSQATVTMLQSQFVKVNNIPAIISQNTNHHLTPRQEKSSAHIDNLIKKESNYYNRNRDDILRKKKDSYKKKTKKNDAISKSQPANKYSKYYQLNKEKIIANKLQKYHSQKSKHTTPGDVTCTITETRNVENIRKNQKLLIQTSEILPNFSNDITEKGLDVNSTMEIDTQNIVITNEVTIKRQRDHNDFTVGIENYKKVNRMNAHTDFTNTQHSSSSVTSEANISNNNGIISHVNPCIRFSHSTCPVSEELKYQQKNIENLKNLETCIEATQDTVVIGKKRTREVAIEEFIEKETQNILVKTNITNKSQRDSSVFLNEKSKQIKRSTLEKKLEQIKLLRFTDTDKITYLKNKYGKLNNERRVFNMKIKLAKKIKRKYSIININQTTNKLLQSKETFVRRIMSNLNSSSLNCRIDVENKVSACIYARDHHVLKLKKTLKNLQQKAELSLTRLRGISIVNNEKCVLTALCGLPKHTSSSELYFKETAYLDLDENWFKSNMTNSSEMPMIEISKNNEQWNEELDVEIANGQLQTRVNMSAVIKKSSEAARMEIPINNMKNIGKSNEKANAWVCHEYCKVVDPDILIEIKELFESLLDVTYIGIHNFIQRIDICSNTSKEVDRRGHPKACYDEPLLCSSKFLKLNMLAVHYPHLRTMKRLIYSLQFYYKAIHEVDSALTSGDFDKLEMIANEAKRSGIAIRVQPNNEICLDEQKIKDRFHAGIKEYTAIDIDPPSIPCISCERLFCRRVVDSFNKNNNVRLNLELLEMKNDVLEKIEKLANEHDSECFICRHCWGHVKKGNIPSFSRLNNLIVEKEPEELKCLSWIEKIFIQRAKAFQTVVKMDTVMKKNLPNHVKIDKVSGRTFHLPLPLEETLKKICPDTDPLNTDHELYILVRANPSKKKIIWEDYVDVKKIWAALFWLQINNPIYANIVLPSHPEDLLKGLQEIEFVHEEKNEENTKAHFTNNNITDDSNDSTKNDVNPLKQAALITQKSKSDSFYDQYTIYPLYGKRINETDTKLYQMLQVYASALDVRGKDLDLKCFPDLYPYGKCGQGEQRVINLRDYDFIRSRLTSRHPQFRLNIQYLFYLLFNNNIRQISAGIFHKMNIINPRYKYTAQQLMDNLEKDQLESNLNTIFSRLRGTEAYWKRVRNDLNCMMNEYGPVTFFITLSPGEWMWSSLGEYIREANGWTNDKRSISELVAADPVSSSRYIHNKFQAMLKYILSSAYPIGKVSHYYYVCEYQGRGLPHYHCLFWIQDAPIYGVHSNEDVQNFILKYITCRIPDKRISPELHRRVMDYQQHKHNNYCMRQKKMKAGLRTACRFGFPRQVTKNLLLRDVSLAIANRSKLKKNKSRFYDLPRQIEEQCINDYMPSLLILWEGNMDAQYICESSYLLTKYVSSYGTKGEKSVLDFSDEQSNKSLCSRLWSISLRALSHRDCGAIEAADTLLGHPLHATDPDTIIRWLDVNMIRSRKLKPFSEIKKLSPDSEDIFYDSFIDTHYCNRPKELESLCLYDFAKWFDIIKNQPIRKAEYYKMNDGLFCRKRNKPYLINHYKYNAENQPEAYYYALLLLFKPWRNTDELKGSEKTFAESFQKQQCTLAAAMKYHDKCNTIQQAIDNMNKLIEKQALEESQTKTQSNTNNIPEGCVPVEVENAMKDFIDLGQNNEIDNEEDLQLRIQQFNEDQSRVFNKITNTVKNETKILRLFVSGSGGTGKSFIIRNLVAWNKLTRNKETAVTAPTGIAAYNIGGITIHRLLQLPVEHGCTAKYKELSDAALKQIRETLKNVDLIILDEVSMVSNIMFMYIHLRLTEIFDTSDCEDGWFGKMNIIVFGDLLQLPPVHEDFAFIQMNKLKIEKYIGSMSSFNLWSLFDYDELVINMRQKDDKLYSEILSRIRLGLIIENDIPILEKRKITFSKTNHLEVMEELHQYWKKLPEDTVSLLPTRNMCNILNTFMMNKIDGEEIVLIANDSFKSPKNLQKKILKILDKDEDNICGIDRVIKIKIGSRVMIRRNIDVSIGLVNGTIGKIISISKDKNNEITNLRITLKSGKEHSITRLEYKFMIMDKICIVREQFPITNSYGITIHKSQGLSLENAIVEAGNGIFSNGQTYVALSRVTRIEGLHLINFDPSRCTADKSAILEYNRLRVKNRFDMQSFQLPRTRKEMIRCKVTDIFAWTIVFNCDHENSTLNLLSNDNWNVRGLPNIDSVSCHINACLQSLFHSATVRRVLLQHSHDDFVKIIFNQYISKNPVDIKALREFADGRFTSSSVQQDAAEFLSYLCSKSIILHNIIEHDLTTVIRCPTCDARSSTTTTNYILTLILPEETQTYTLQEIIDNNIENWRQLEEDGTCENGCKSKKIQKTNIEIKNTIIIIKLLLFSNLNGKIQKMCNFKIKDVPKSKVSINKKIYTVINAIFHHGNNCQSGHYTNMLKQHKNWTNVNDLVIKKKQWPKCAKDAYIFFLERSENKR